MKAMLRTAVTAHARWILVLGLALLAVPARAQQLLVVDSTYTATAQNTDSSHYRIKPLASVPSNWRTPVDYGSGTVYVRMEVLEKPSDAKTLVNICFEGSTKTCMPYPPAHTAPGVYTFSNPFSAFWHYDMVDWTQGIKDVAVVLKTEAEVEAQGDPLFYPAKMHVTVSVVPPGETFVPPGAGADDDAGVTPKDAGVTPKDAGTVPKPDAGTKPDASTDAATAPRDAAVTPIDAGVKPPTAAGAGGSTASASANAGQAAPGSDGGAGHHVSDYLTSDAGCATRRPGHGSNRPVAWLALVAYAWLATTRRSRRKP